MKIRIGERLREERERLGLSQAAMGEIAGIRKQTQLKYEKGDSCPDAAYLDSLSKFGLDVLYVVSGVHSITALSNDEEELIGHYRSAPLAVKQAVFAALTVGAPSGSGSTINVAGGSGQRIAGRDFHEHKK